MLPDDFNYVVQVTPDWPVPDSLIVGGLLAGISLNHRPQVCKLFVQ